MQYHCELRMRKKRISYLAIPFFDESKIWKNEYILRVKMKQYSFLTHFTYKQPKEIHPDDFPQPDFQLRMIDPFNTIIIQLFIFLSFTFGLFSFYPQLFKFWV